MILILLLTLSALFGASSAVSPCLDPTDTDYSCEVNSSGELSFGSCAITDEDVDSGDLASCLDAAGRGNIADLSLEGHNLTTLPEGIFQNLTSLTELYLYNNSLTTLPEGIFQDVTTVTNLNLGVNAFTTLPENIFQNLTALKSLNLTSNAFASLPEALFQDLTSLNNIYLNSNVITALPEGIFQALTALTVIGLSANDLTTLPEGIFQNSTALEIIKLGGNDLTTLSEGIFQTLTALEYLSLYNNDLTTLPEGTFQNSTALTELVLGSNALTTLPEGIFRNATALETLSLYENDLTTLPEDVFQTSTALNKLSLYNIHLFALPEGIFQTSAALTELLLGSNALNTLPEDIFRNCTALETLYLGSNNLTTLPEGIFQHLPALGTLSLSDNAFTALPEGIFQNSTALTELFLSSNDLTTLPEGIFRGLTALTQLALNLNELTALPEGIFQNLTALTQLNLSGNNLTTLPEGIFQDLTALTYLDMTGNALECLPTTRLVELDDDATSSEDGLHVDPYGDECGCSIVNVTDDVCGEETCNPGPVGYTCDMGTESPGLVTPAPEYVVEPTPPPRSGSRATSAAPTPAPLFDISPTTNPVSASAEEEWASDSTLIVAGMVSAVVVAALIALAVLLKRSRTSDPKSTYPPVFPSTDGDGNLEQGREHLPEARPSTSAVLCAGDGGDRRSSGHRSAQAGRFGRKGVVLPLAPTSLYARVQSGAGDVNNASDADQCGLRLVGEDGTCYPAEKVSAATITPSAPTVDMSTVGRAELAQFNLRQRDTRGASVSRGFKPEEDFGSGSGTFVAAEREGSASEIRLCHAVLAAAQDLAHHCQIPGISEAASAVSIMANLVTDNRESDRASETKLRQCRTIVMTLQRAATVADKGGDTIGEAARILIEDVHEAIFDLVELVKTFESKNKLSKLLMSTLFKRRQFELNAVVDQAIMRLQLGLQLQVGHDVSAIRGDVSEVKDGFKSVKEEILFYQGSIADATSESVAEARSIRRQRKLDQVEIPEDHVSITNDLLGKGGFGEVYLADYNGHNAAAKVLFTAPDLGVSEENRIQREASQRKAFLRELEAMIRLRSPNTVNIYGAVTSLSDRMVLVMELLAGGDLLTLLRQSAEPLPVDQSRRIIKDICTGMAFLHSKNTVHGDLKSANVLLDGDGRAKIADFGTSRWSQHTNCTGLATYTTRSSQSTQMSVAWSAPEVLDSERSTCKSDVYSFGIVVWEVISRELPWAHKTRPTEILTSVLRGHRPSFRVDAPADLVDVAKACWDGNPNERTTFQAILEGMGTKGWSDEKA